MGNRGRLSGTPCHIEYHTVSRKKTKAADCIYLDQNRICHCKRSPWYTSKCFEATTCTFRERDKVKEKSLKEKSTQNDIKKAPLQRAIKDPGESIKCPIPMGSTIIHKTYGEGRLCAYDKTKEILTIQFQNKESRFSYPDAFQKGFLKLKTNYSQKE